MDRLVLWQSCLGMGTGGSNEWKASSTILKSSCEEETLKLRASFRKRLLENDGSAAGSLDFGDDSFSASAGARRELVRKKAWQLAILPVKTLWMNCLMMYMMGSGGVFFFIILGYALLTAFRVLLNCNKTFDELQTSANTPDVSMLLQRIVYAALAVSFIGYFFFQCAKIGLLPLKEVDVAINHVSNSLAETATRSALLVI